MYSGESAGFDEVLILDSQEHGPSRKAFITKSDRINRKLAQAVLDCHLPKAGD